MDRYHPRGLFAPTSNNNNNNNNIAGRSGGGAGGGGGSSAASRNSAVPATQELGGGGGGGGSMSPPFLASSNVSVMANPGPTANTRRGKYDLTLLSRPPAFARTSALPPPSTHTTLLSRAEPRYLTHTLGDSDYATQFSLPDAPRDPASLYSMRGVVTLKKDLEGIMGELLRQLRVAVGQVCAIRDAVREEEVRRADVAREQASAREDIMARVETIVQTLETSTRGKLTDISKTLDTLKAQSTELRIRQTTLEASLTVGLQNIITNSNNNNTNTQLDTNAIATAIATRLDTAVADACGRIENCAKNALDRVCDEAVERTERAVRAAVAAAGALNNVHQSQTHPATTTTTYPNSHLKTEHDPPMPFATHAPAIPSPSPSTAPTRHTVIPATPSPAATTPRPARQLPSLRSLPKPVYMLDFENENWTDLTADLYPAHPTTTTTTTPHRGLSQQIHYQQQEKQPEPVIVVDDHDNRDAQQQEAILINSSPLLTSIDPPPPPPPETQQEQQPEVNASVVVRNTTPATTAPTTTGSPSLSHTTHPAQPKLKPKRKQKPKAKPEQMMKLKQETRLDTDATSSCSAEVETSNAAPASSSPAMQHLGLRRLKRERNPRAVPDPDLRPVTRSRKRKLEADSGALEN